MSKAIGFYWESGPTVKVHTPLRGLSVEGAVYSSALGSAFRSNAVKQTSFLVQADFNWLRKRDRAWFLETGLNVGYFKADYELAIFDVLDSSAPILGLELTTGYRFSQIVAETGFGYHSTAGDGLSGPGTLYPFYWQTSIRWRF